MAELSGWQNFYVIVGSAAATLTGLMFIAISIVAGTERRSPTLGAGIEAFTTPTVVHFGAVLLTGIILSAPWPSILSLSLALRVVGIALVIYLLIVMGRVRQVPGYHAPLKDWLWYFVFPLAAYGILIGAAVALTSSAQLALFCIAAALALVVFIGMHNAWDLVTFFAIVRPQSTNTNK